MTSMFRKFTLFLGILTIAGLYLNPYSKNELLVYALKYSHLNIEQNTGLHKLVLKTINRAASALYQPTIYQKPENLGNVGSFVSSTLTKESIPYVVYVSSLNELLKALDSAQPGDYILLLPGVYKINISQILITNSGTESAPITLGTSQLGDVTLIMDSIEGFLIKAKYWRIENLIFKGIKGKDSSIEHAIHLSGDADNVAIVNNRFINFNSHIKSNGYPNSNGKISFPDNIVISNNDIYNQWKRNTKSPATPIDIVGGDNVVVKNNFIADFGKYGRKGFGTTYGAYMKGGGINGLFENNVVMCEWQVPHTSSMDIRIGISFGNGGTGGKYCADGECEVEHERGIIRNNTILNCINDVGIYLNKSRNTTIENNAIRSSLGIDVRFAQSNAVIKGNIIEGRVKSRDGAIISLEDNIIE